MQIIFYTGHEIQAVAYAKQCSTFVNHLAAFEINMIVFDM